MKRFFLRLCAAIVIFASVAPPVQAAVVAASGEEAVAGRSYFYTTFGGNEENYLVLSLRGTVATLIHRTKIKHRWGDAITVSRGVNKLQQVTASWQAVNSAGVYTSSQTLDLGGCPDGPLTIQVQSVLDFSYESLNVTVRKDGNECYMESNSLSRRQNSALATLLSQKKAPDDFSALKKLYAGEEDRKTLEEIEQTAQRIVENCNTDRAKVLALYKWITENIAFDADMSEHYYTWIEKHPEDVRRLDDPLLAFRNRYGLCYGFSKLTVLMMGYAGVECVYLRGWMFDAGEDEYSVTQLPADNGINHAWNAVKVDDSWYSIDTSRMAIRNYYQTAPAQEQFKTVRNLTYQHLFPSHAYLSQNQFAIRVGVQNFGVKV